MSYKSTSSIPQDRIRSARGLFFDNTHAEAVNLWTPANGKRVFVNDVMLAVINKATNTYIGVGVQVLIGGNWELLLPVAVGPLAAATIVHDFGQRVQTQFANGGAVMRVIKFGNSSSWEARINVTGEEG